MYVAVIPTGDSKSVEALVMSRAKVKPIDFSFVFEIVDRQSL